MCMCGGIIEAGLIAALIGYIGKKIQKCKCQCHDEHIEKCKHCTDKQKTNKDCQNCQNHTKEHKCHNHKKHNIVQYILTTILIIGIGFVFYGVHKMISHHECHDKIEEVKK